MKSYGLGASLISGSLKIPRVGVAASGKWFSGHAGDSPKVIGW